MIGRPIGNEDTNVSFQKRAMENGNGTAESAYANLFNVRNQFTMWGPDSQINDYAARHYSGLMLYYRFV